MAKEMTSLDLAAMATKIIGAVTARGLRILINDEELTFLITFSRADLHLQVEEISEKLMDSNGMFAHGVFQFPDDDVSSRP